MVRRNGMNMRSGISLVEMLLAIILFGAISTIGFKYAKNFYNVNLASKQALVSAVVDQATQLSNAYDIYQTKKGVAPAAETDLIDPSIKILTKIPDDILAITDDDDGWKLTKINLDGSTDAENDTVFIYKVTSATSSDVDKLTFCNILNNIEDSSYSLDTAKSDIGAADTMYDGTATAANGHLFHELMCYYDDTDLIFAFIKEIDTN